MGVEAMNQWMFAGGGGAFCVIPMFMGIDVSFASWFLCASAAALWWWLVIVGEGIEE